MKMPRGSRQRSAYCKRVRVEIAYYYAFHDVVKRGRITALNNAYRKLKLDDEIIKFDDIYAITVIDV